MHLTEAELARRRPVWSALSDLFLDTETRWYFPHVAQVLVDSGLAAPELERIWRYEIVPECSWNLHQVAGEWAVMPLDEARLIERAEREPGLGDRLRAGLQDGLGSQWEQLVRLTSTLAALEPGERARTSAAWTSFAHAYLEERLEDVTFLDSKIKALRSTGLSRSQLERTFEADFRPVYRELLIGKARGGEAQRAENVRQMIARSAT